VPIEEEDEEDISYMAHEREECQRLIQNWAIEQYVVKRCTR
jgi:hypothetical protein